jgi:hypothetical protein
MQRSSSRRGTLLQNLVSPTMGGGVKRNLNESYKRGCQEKFFPFLCERGVMV